VGNIKFDGNDGGNRHTQGKFLYDVEGDFRRIVWGKTGAAGSPQRKLTNKTKTKSLASTGAEKQRSAGFPGHAGCRRENGR